MKTFSKGLTVQLVRKFASRYGTTPSPVLNDTNPVHALPSSFFKILFNIICLHLVGSGWRSRYSYAADWASEELRFDLRQGKGRKCSFSVVKDVATDVSLVYCRT